MLAKEGLMCQKEKGQTHAAIVQYVPHVVFDKFDIGRYVDWAC